MPVDNVFFFTRLFFGVHLTDACVIICQKHMRLFLILFTKVNINDQDYIYTVLEHVAIPTISAAAAAAPPYFPTGQGQDTYRSRYQVLSALITLKLQFFPGQLCLLIFQLLGLIIKLDRLRNEVQIPIRRDLGFFSGQIERIPHRQTTISTTSLDLFLPNIVFSCTGLSSRISICTGHKFQERFF